MIVKVRVYPKSAREKVIVVDKENYLIYVKELPIRGLANKRIALILSLRFNVPLQKVRLRAGVRARNKTFEINGL